MRNGRIATRPSASGECVFSANLARWRAPVFQTSWIAGLGPTPALPPAGLQTCGTADLEVCATLNRYIRVELKGRMEHKEGVGNLMAWPNGLGRRSGPHPALLVKPGQTWSNRFSPGPIWASFTMSLLYVVGSKRQYTRHGGWPLRIQEAGQANRNCAIVRGHSRSNPVTPGQTWSKRKKRFDRQTPIRLQARANHQEIAEKLLLQLALLIQFTVGCCTVSGKIGGGHRPCMCLARTGRGCVAQVSKPAVPPASKPAPLHRRQRVWKPAPRRP